MIATVIECCEEPRPVAPGHPPTETVRVLATLRQFLREGTPWRSLRAGAHKVSGSTLRRWLTAWARTGLLRKVNALLTILWSTSPQGGLSARPIWLLRTPPLVNRRDLALWRVHGRSLRRQCVSRHRDVLNAGSTTERRCRGILHMEVTVFTASSTVKVS